MDGVRLGDYIGIREDLINKVCSIAMKAHKYSGKQYLSEKIRNSSQVVFSFPGSWSVTEWYSKGPFGEVKVDNQLFPCLKYIGLDDTASVNEAFFNRFKLLCLDQHFRKEVGAAAADKKQVIFAGHSSGGPVAILAAIWFLEEYIRRPEDPPPNKVAVPPPLCLTFGSPLVGDHILSHSLTRENWSHYFVNFVMAYDIVPRLSLTPLSAIHDQFQPILSLLSPKPPREPLGEQALLHFFITVMRNVSSVASHAACKIMGSTNLLLETVSNFVELSPYRPLGTFVFCTGNGRLLVVKNPEAILQLLFYTSQLNSEAELAIVAQSSISTHLNYHTELLDSLEMQSLTFLDDHHLEALPLEDGALNELGLSARARLCLRAAGELEKQKRNNQIENDQKLVEMEKELKKLQGYQKKCQHKGGYYDAFKKSQDKDDFDANVTRLKLAGMWDEIIEMLKRYQLPHGYESRKEWIEIGTRYRRLVEPLDIANYYRHLKNEDTGPYMDRGRPKRYKCTQRWLEHAERMTNPALESCFWAEVEELCVKLGSFGVRDQAYRLKIQAEEWIRKGCLDQDVFSKGSTFDKLLKEHFLTLEQPVAYQGMWK